MFLYCFPKRYESLKSELFYECIALIDFPWYHSHLTELFVKRTESRPYQCQGAGDLEVVDDVEALPVAEVDDEDEHDGEDARDHGVQLPAAVHCQVGDLRELRLVTL